MKRIILIVLIVLMAMFVGGVEDGCSSQENKDRSQVRKQQGQYAVVQSVPMFDWSLERHMLIQLYQTRNMEATTHSVWRGLTSVIEGDCPSMGFSLPYDTSLTNPLQHFSQGGIIEQAEPNGIFASKNTAATWVLCVNSVGMVTPIYVETTVTVYPYPVKIDYKNNRVIKAGKSSVNLTTSKD